MKKINEIISIAAISFFATACATPNTPSATHSWNAEDKTTAEYRLDNFSCLNGAKASEDSLAIGDQKFDHYKTCMLDRGYVLRTY